MRRALPLSAAAVSTLAVCGLTSPAFADPLGAKETEVIPLSCDDGNIYTVVVTGNGDFTPAHDLDSTSVFVPVWFGPSHFELRDQDGNLLFSEDDPADAKGAGRNADLSCTYEVTFTFEDPDLGTVSGSASGSVAGFRTPRR